MDYLSNLPWGPLFFGIAFKKFGGTKPLSFSGDSPHAILYASQVRERD